MLAISGLHLTLLGMGFFSLLRRMRTGVLPAAVLSGIFLFVYTVFTGCSVSTVRAFLMFLFVMGAKISGRTYDAWNSIALSAILILAENPWYLFYSGFQLSYAAVITCVIFRRSGKVLMALMLYLFTLPLILLSYYEIPLFGIGVNLLTVPLLPAVLLCGIGGMLLGGWAALPATLLVRFDQFLLHLVGNLPFKTFLPGNPSPWMLFLYAGLLGLGIFFYRRHRHEKKRLFVFLCLPLLLGVFALHFPQGLSLAFLDVGQGDGIVLSMPSGNQVLIDGGSSSVRDVGKNRIMPYLKYRGIRHLDYLFLTHMDADHISGAQEMLRMAEAHTTSLSVGTLVLPKLAVCSESCRELKRLARAAGVRILSVSKGDAFSFGTTKLEILNPTREGSKEEEPEENEQCLVLAVHEGSFDALLTGDVSGEGEENLIKTFQENKDRYEVLKVAHHGSRLSTSAEFLSLVRPAVGIISAGKGNRYGHPHAQLLQRLRAGGTKILRTDEAGEIEIKSDGQSFSVTPFLNKKEEKSSFCDCTG